MTEGRKKNAEFGMRNSERKKEERVLNAKLGRRQMTEDRGERAEDRGQKAEDRGIRFGITDWGIIDIGY